MSQPPVHPPAPVRGPKHRRTLLACRNCRQKKTRCITTEQPPTHPCQNCQAKGLTCEYIAVPDSVPSSPDPSDSDPQESQASSSSSHDHRRRSAAYGPPLLLHPAPGSFPVNTPYTYAPSHAPAPVPYQPPPLLHPMHHARQHQPVASSSRRRHHPPPVAPHHHSYEVQAAHAQQYLAMRTRPPPPSHPNLDVPSLEDYTNYDPTQDYIQWPPN
ncbi:hypothetical protein C8R46DRAFT_1300679 [Mycena filopes]|nr:hypothetical protein C8R46DRAFT_1300679 [Mycena filopes]